LSFEDIFGIRKIVCVILRLVVSVEHRLVTDKVTDRQIHDGIYRARMALRVKSKTMQCHMKCFLSAKINHSIMYQKHCAYFYRVRASLVTNWGWGTALSCVLWHANYCLRGMTSEFARMLSTMVPICRPQKHSSVTLNVSSEKSPAMLPFVKLFDHIFILCQKHERFDKIQTLVGCGVGSLTLLDGREEGHRPVGIITWETRPNLEQKPG